MATEALQGAKEAARLGRMVQLQNYAAFKKGKTVTFPVHNDPRGYKILQKDLPAPPQKTTRVKWTNDLDMVYAAQNNDVATVKALLSSGVAPDTPDVNGATALHHACLNGFISLVY